MNRLTSLFLLAASFFLAPLFAREEAFLPVCVMKGDVLEVAFSLPPGGHVYREGFAVAVNGQTVSPLEASPPAMIPDALTGGEIAAYEGAVFFHYRVSPPFAFSVSYQACDADQCHLPKTLAYSADALGNVALIETPPAAPSDPAAWVPEGFSVRTGGGYMNADEFLAFLKGDTASATGFKGFLSDPAEFVRQRGLWLALFFVLLGGVLLNLTPCVLPMIPVSLAIIGAGGGKGRRIQGAIRGGAYGLGIAAVYGSLGLAVVLTGGFFGAIQASPWFNLGVAALFAVLALSLFDLFFIDFSRFSSPDPAKQKQGIAAAFATGAVSALLAGACVAPVVLAVLLLTGAYYAQGRTAALLLPFLLGLGMALPWPIAGAGLSIAPRPGMWMVRVKQIFGALLILLALWYGKTAFEGFTAKPAETASENAFSAGDRAAWEKAVEQAKAENKMLVVDFWATWCKNCLAMEKTTFRNERVKAALAGSIVVNVQAERPNEGSAKAMLDAFSISGLPGFLILTPGKEIQ